jgi:hypothetical protein
MAAMPKRHKLGFWQFQEWHFLMGFGNFPKAGISASKVASKYV